MGNGEQDFLADLINDDASQNVGTGEVEENDNEQRILDSNVWSATIFIEDAAVLPPASP